MAGNEKQGVKNIHLPMSSDNRYPEDDDSNENAIKAKHARIADMFLARPAAQDVKIAVSENSVQDVIMAKKKKLKKQDKKNEEKGKEKEEKLKDKKKKKKQDKKNEEKGKGNEEKGKYNEEKGEDNEEKLKDKKKKKVEPNQNTTDVEEQKNQVPDDIITVIEEGIDAKEAWKILSCFDFIRSWYSKKKQKRQEKRELDRLKHQEKKERKRLEREEKRNRRKGLPIVTVVEIHEPPSTYVNNENEGYLDACDVDDVDISFF